MKHFVFLLIAFIPVIGNSQIHSESSEGVTRIFPFSVIRPATTILPGSIVSDQRECATSERDTTEFFNQPWIGNNQYLSHLLASLGYPLSSSNYRVELGNEVKYKIPVKFWVYRNSNGLSDVNLTDIQIWMDSLNHYFRLNNTGFRFYQIDGVEFINNTNLTDVGILAEIGNWVNGRHVNRAVNVHVVRAINGGAGYFTIFPKPAIFFETRGDGAGELNSSTLIHEMGHHLGLDHTHQYYWWRGWPFENCLVEPVDRNRRFAALTLCNSRPFENKLKCEVTGDGLRDTPADPEIIREDHQNCQWNAAEHPDDIYGDSYSLPPPGSQSPNVRNFMAYGNQTCRSFFSYGQIGVMVHSIEAHNGLNRPRRDEWTDPAVVFDIFEPDNLLETARTFTLNDQQYHTFHTEYSGNVANDVDWLTFNVPESGLNYTVKTSPVSGQTNADTEIRLYRVVGGALTLLSTDDNSAGNGYSLISQTLSSGNHAIEVINRNTTVSGHYNIILFNCADPQALIISGPSIVCASNSSFALSGVPTGAAISWSASSNLQYVSGQGTSNFTVRSNGAGEGFVLALVCGNIQVPQKNFHVGGYSSSDYPVTGPGNACNNETVYYNTADLQGATYYDWFWPSDWTYSGGQGTRYLTLITGSNSTGGAVGVRVANACDAGGSPASVFTYVSSCGGFSAFSVYPNPVADEITVSLEDFDSLGNKKAKIEKLKKLEFEVSLFDNKKNKVITLTSKDEMLSIPVRNLPEGLYYLNIIFKEGIIQRQILVKRN